jgi:hypothetical protein
VCPKLLCFRLSSLGHSYRAIYRKKKEFIKVCDPVAAGGNLLILAQESSQTNWHVKPTGSAFWTHVLVGKQIFYVLKPTVNNLAMLARFKAMDVDVQRRDFLLL